MDSFCEGCGQYTTRRGAFSELLCAECHEAQDEAIEAIEAAERAEAKRRGYSYGWSEE